MLLRNKTFSIAIDAAGYVDKLLINDDPEQMNWVVDRTYIDSVGYQDKDKLFGMFELKTAGNVYSSTSVTPAIQQEADRMVVTYPFESFAVEQIFSTKHEDALTWGIRLVNGSDAPLVVDSFYVWMSLAYVMFKDTNVQRNISQSCALFPSISEDYTKFAGMRRSNIGPHLGVYGTQGRTYSLGAYCRYENLFLEQVSPSLDGILYHSLILAGQGMYAEEQKPAQSWIYPDIYTSVVEVEPQGASEWSYTMLPFDNAEQFQSNGGKLSHPIVSYEPMVIAGGVFEAKVQLPTGRRIRAVELERAASRSNVMEHVQSLGDSCYRIGFTITDPGEAKLRILLDDGTADFVVFNVSEPIADILEARADYLCTHSYDEKGASGRPHVFLPESNQGESLGKLSFVLLKNLIADRNLSQVHKVERSAALYVRNKWFEDGDFRRPVKLYGGFYRIFDFDYIGHVFYLLSRYQDNELQLNTADTYLRWAAELMIVRFDDRLHEDSREKKETKLTGTFTHFMKDLMDVLRGRPDFKALYDELSVLWDAFFLQLREQSGTYRGAITEHFYDNAGFGPTCEALCLAEASTEASRYGELILANIGYSNDYRAQNPDRWWEALAYMAHSLWGGMVSYSSLVAYEHLKNPAYLEAAYRSAVPIFLCYDWNVESTAKRITRGEAASTYCVPNPNMNKPRISHNRFGQSVFMEDNPELFAGATGDDWDMGEELAVYLMGFGTKTFLYMDGEELKCVNGHVSVQDGRTVVTSYAAYPKAYYFFEKGESLLAAEGECIPSIIIENGRLVRMEDVVAVK